MTDQEPTQKMPAEPEGDPPRRHKRLVRSRSDRMLGGVAGGLADYFGVDPVIFRIAFGVTVLFGGFGVISYIALLIFVPSEDSGAPGEDPTPRSAGRIALTGLAVIGALTGLAVLAATGAWAGATGHGSIVALVIIGIGALLAGAAFKGGARWLIVPALALAIPLGGVAAADVEFDGSVGDRDYRPAMFEAIPADGYELGMGELTVDLRDLPWERGSVARIQTDQGLGDTRIAVPADVCVVADASADLGSIRLAGRETEGVDVELQANQGSEVTPRVEIDTHVDIGEIRVVNDDDADPGRGFDGGDDDEHDEDEMDSALDAACESGQAGTREAELIP